MNTCVFEQASYNSCAVTTLLAIALGLGELCQHNFGHMIHAALKHYICMQPQHLAWSLGQRLSPIT